MLERAARRIRIAHGQAARAACPLTIKRLAGLSALRHLWALTPPEV
jgi:hypothetical protein